MQPLLILDADDMERYIRGIVKTATGTDDNDLEVLLEDGTVTIAGSEEALVVLRHTLLGDVDGSPRTN